MSTRTNIKVKSNGEMLVTLYRHYDGYPAETGANLVEVAQKHDDGARFCRELMAQTYDKADYETEARPMYRIEETAGDIEHYYVVMFNYGHETEIYHAEYNYKRDGSGDEWMKSGTVYTLNEFIAVVNQERKDINAHLAVNYPDATHYPMLETAEFKAPEPRVVYEPEPEPATEPFKPTGKPIELRDMSPGWSKDKFNADIWPKQAIRLFGTFTNRANGPVDYDITFKIGDDAEYGSYNLIYTGEIVSIGPKTVTIQHPGGSQKTRLKIVEFAYKNWDYDSERISKHNYTESLYI